jgi:FAD/FMN-containing dehydrogenase
VSELTQILRTQMPDSGAYWSESDFLEPDWQDAFWGTKYSRLQAVKKAVDPLGVFQCHHCVELP